MLEINYPKLINSISPQEIIEMSGSPQESFFLFVSYGFELLLILSVIVFIGTLLFGGFLYLSSVGDPEKRREGVERIKNAVQGAFIVLMSFLILTTINQQIVLFSQNEIIDPERAVELEYPEWEIRSTYFQMPLGLLVEDAILNDSAQDKLYDVLEATYEAENVSDKIEKASIELLEIIESCPEGQECCDVESVNISNQEKWLRAFQFQEKIDFKKRTINEVEKLLQDQEVTKNILEDLGVKEIEEAEILLKEYLQEEKDFLEKEEAVLEDIVNKLEEETEDVSEKEKAQEQYEENKEDEVKDSDIVGVAVGAGAVVSPPAVQLLSELISSAVKNWWEENEVKEKLDDILNPSKNALPSMLPIDINIDLALDTPARAEQHRLIQENWDNSGPIGRAISKWIFRTGNIYFDGLLGDYANFPVIGAPPLQEMMFGKDYDRSPQTIIEKGLYYLGAYTPDIVLSLILPQAGGIKFLTNSRLALRLAQSSSFMGRLAYKALTLYSGDIAIDTTIAAIRQALNREATTGERAMNFGYEVLFSLIPRFGIDAGGEVFKRIGKKIGLIDNIDIKPSSQGLTKHGNRPHANHQIFDVSELGDNVVINKYGYADTPWTRMFGYSDNGGNVLGDILHVTNRTEGLRHPNPQIRKWTQEFFEIKKSSGGSYSAHELQEYLLEKVMGSSSDAKRFLELRKKGLAATAEAEFSQFSGIGDIRIDAGDFDIQFLDVNSGQKSIVTRSPIPPPKSITPNELIQYDALDWRRSLSKYGENAYNPTLENFIGTQRGKQVKIVSLENMDSGGRLEQAQLFEALISRPNQIPLDADVIIYGHGYGSWNTSGWRAQHNGASVMNVVEQNLKPNQTALVIVCADEGKSMYTSARGYGFYNNGSEIVPINGSQLHQMDLTRSPDYVVGPSNATTSPSTKIETSTENTIIDINVEDLLPQKIDHSSYFSMQKEGNLARLKTFFNYLIGAEGAFASQRLTCSWVGGACSSPCINSSYRECGGGTTKELLSMLCCCCPEEDDEPEEELLSCPSCPIINPPVQAKIAEIEDYLAELSLKLDELILTKEPLKEDLYQLYKVIMLKSLGKREVFGYNSLLLEVSRHERGAVVIETDTEETIIGKYFWDWSQWINNILYEIEINDIVIKENDPVTFYLRKPGQNKLINDALTLAKEAKQNDIQSIGKIGKEKENNKSSLLESFVNFTKSFIEKNRTLSVSAQENSLALCAKENNISDLSKLSPEEFEELIEICGLNNIVFDGNIKDIKLPGDYLSCGIEIPTGEALELTWNHLMELLDTIDDYVEEGRKLIEQQTKMNELSRSCECPCQDPFCPFSCGQCELTCNLAAIRAAHEEVLGTREKMKEIAAHIELLTYGHFNTPTEDVCDLLNEEIRSAEEKVLCQGGGKKLITKHELITRKLNYSRFALDECSTRQEALDDVLEGRRQGKAPLFGPIAEEKDLPRQAKIKEGDFLINTSDFNWFCCSQLE